MKKSIYLKMLDLERKYDYAMENCTVPERENNNMIKTEKLLGERHDKRKF